VGNPAGGPLRRLDSLRSLLAQVREQAGFDLGFVLWDGSTVPSNLRCDAFAVRIADEGVIAGLVRRPTLETFANVWVAKRIDLVNGTLFDLAHLRKTRRTREFRKSLDKRLVMRALLPFLFVSRGGPWPLDAQPDAGQNSDDLGDNRRNIAYHYDVSNNFYALWLDREMVYSCGYCTDWTNDLERMQRDKLEMICRKLRLKPGERLLDIGCGWGALVVYAAQHYGVEAYGVTLSERQFGYAREKVERLGLQDLVRIELKDYSLVEGEERFDKVASIGFFEHVGLTNFSTYYETVRRVLKRDGLFLHHAITRPGEQKHGLSGRGRAEGRLFNKYIFPGGRLDHIGNTVAMMERHGFEVHDVENWREHYQRTCRHWHDRLLKNHDAAVAEIGETKTRLWLTYLAVCSIMFERNVFNLHQTLASKRRRGASGLPPTRSDLYRERP
jgi:cyclopropane-fatty-acyl-phospholipid synthase